MTANLERRGMLSVDDSIQQWGNKRTYILIAFARQRRPRPTIVKGVQAKGSQREEDYVDVHDEASGPSLYERMVKRERRQGERMLAKGSGHGQRVVVGAVGNVGHRSS